MKKLTFLAVALIVIVTGCKKDEKAPTPGTPAVTASGMTATETALLGTWIWDKTEYWNGGSLMFFYDSAYCALNYPIGAFNAWVRPSTFECRTSLSVLWGPVINNAYDGLSDTGRGLYTSYTHGATWWVNPVGSLYPCETVVWHPADDGVFMFPSGGENYIETLTASNLVLTMWNSGPTGTGGLANGCRYYYHK